ncbi:ATP-binding protein [Mammaliicoccus sciuri]|uniref:ATP-binding protein n=1 Tax=Sporosarcina sp. FSL K6-3508 TaxID=2921557 RepID=UPI00315A502E
MVHAFESVFEKLNVRKVEDLFFKIHPDYVQSVSEVRMEFVQCPACQQHTKQAWVYCFDGDRLQEDVWSICHECQKQFYTLQVGAKLIQKRQDIVDGDWYYINSDDKAGFKNFEELNPELTAAKGKATDYIKDLLEGKIRNLRISGTPGTGKTHLAKAIARTLKHKGRKVAFIESRKLFDNIKNTFGNRVAQERFEKQFADFDLVVLDDVGVETNKAADELSWSSREWVKLIDLRRGKSTVYTTNFDKESLKAVIGARSVSRIGENSETIELFTPDHDYRDRLLY